VQIVLVQIVLIAAVVAIAARLFRSRGERSQAVRRLGLLLFAAFAVVTILFPRTWTALAQFVGVGRGADLVLYALVVAFLSSTVTTYVRFRDMETRYTRLARRIALDEAGAPPPAAGTNAPDVAGPRT
jgi:hypothetical protein